MQEYMLINNTRVKQPDRGLSYEFETTHTEDSARLQNGKAHVTPMFTVEAFGYQATDLTMAEMSQILRLVAKGARFRLHYLSPYYGAWRNDEFYVGKGSLNVGSWREDKERYDSLSFRMVGVNPI